METQKAIARALERTAERAEYVNASPASPKQCWLLAGLMAERGDEASALGCGAANTSAVLTKKQASRYITQYLREKEG